MSTGTARRDAAYRLVLLDRDGVLNVHRPGRYVSDPDDLELIPGAAEAVARLNAAGVRVVVVTNQRGIARGLMTVADLDRVHDRLREGLAAAGAHLDGIEFCPHAAGECTCRKPAPGMILRALAASGVPATRAVLVGDQPSDLAAAAAAGVAAIRVGPAGEWPDLAAAVRDVLPEMSTG